MQISRILVSEGPLSHPGAVISRRRPRIHIAAYLPLALIHYIYLLTCLECRFGNRSFSINLHSLGRWANNPGLKLYLSFDGVMARWYPFAATYIQLTIRPLSKKPLPDNLFNSRPGDWLHFVRGEFRGLITIRNLPVWSFDHLIREFLNPRRVRLQSCDGDTARR